jgi:hypothetical protein
VSFRVETTDVDGRPLPLLVSSVIPAAFRHGFSTRAGGVSSGPFQSLNLGLSWGDERARVLENRRRLGAACEAGSLHLASQVHGVAVARVRRAGDGDGAARPEADALVSDLPGAALAVLVADCVPVLLADERTGACAAVHAGWRGVVGGVVPAAVAALAADYGARASDLRAALGPAIGACCFEVGPEVVAAFAAASPGGLPPGVVRAPPDGGRPHVDLTVALTAQLEALGVPPEAVDAAGACTRCDAEGRFYSYRRDGAHTGQQMGIIARRGGP